MTQIRSCRVGWTDHGDRSCKSAQTGHDSLRYAPYHASLVEFLSGQSPAGDAADGVSAAGSPLARELRDAAAAAHRRIADRYLSLWGGLDNGLPGLIDAKLAEADGGYGLRHLGTHLAAADRAEELHRLLAVEISDGGRPVNGWFHVHDRYGDLTGFITDLDIATRQAERENDPLLLAGSPAPDVALEIRYALIREAISARASSLPNDLLPQLLDAGIWPAKRALAYARQIRDPAQRARRWPGWPRTSANLNAQRPSPTRSAAARSITDEYARARALAGLAPAPQRTAAGRRAQRRPQHHQRVRPGEALAGLAPQLSEPERTNAVADALTAARSITDEDTRAQALARLAPQLSATAAGRRAQRRLRHHRRARPGPSVGRVGAAAPRTAAGRRTERRLRHHRRVRPGLGVGRVGPAAQRT